MRRGIWHKWGIYLLIFILLCIGYPIKVHAATIVVATTPAQLTEDTLNKTVVTVTLSGDTFKQSLLVTDFSLKNSITGVAIASVQRVSDYQINLSFSYNKSNIDANKTNFIIVTKASALVTTTSNIESSPMIIYAVNEQLSASLIPSPLTEDKLNGGKVTLTLSGDEFVTNISSASFELRNNLSGLRISRVDRISNTQVNVVLAYNGIDFDVNKTNLVIRVYADQYVRYPNDLDTTPITLNANIETSPSITLVSYPTELFENSLNGCNIVLTLRENSFKTPSSASYFRLNNAPPGTIIKSAAYINDYVVSLELLYPDADMEKDITNFSVTALSNAFNTVMEIISDTKTIYAIEDIEGEGFHSSTGESYPTSLQIQGYNSKAGELYISTTLYTSKSVQVSQKITFSYYIDVFNNAGEKVGSYGTEANPRTSTGSNSLKVDNLKIPIALPLTNEYRIVITIKSADIS